MSLYPHYTPITFLCQSAIWWNNLWEISFVGSLCYRVKSFSINKTQIKFLSKRGWICKWGTKRRILDTGSGLLSPSNEWKGWKKASNLHWQPLSLDCVLCVSCNQCIQQRNRIDQDINWRTIASDSNSKRNATAATWTIIRTMQWHK